MANYIIVGGHKMSIDEDCTDNDSMYCWFKGWPWGIGTDTY